MFTVAYNDKTGLVECGCEGFLTVAEIRDYAVKAQAAVDRCRKDHGHVRMLVISLDSTIQSAEVMAEVGKTNWEMHDPRDRMAIVVASALARLQAQRYYHTPQVAIVLSREAGLDWLETQAEARAA